MNWNYRIREHRTTLMTTCMKSKRMNNREVIEENMRRTW